MNLRENIERINDLIYLIEKKTDDILKKNFSINYDFDPQVKELQISLKEKGYDLGTFGPNKDGIDGKYGPITKLAHESFKKGGSPQEFNNKNQIVYKDVNDNNLKNEYNFHLIPDGKNNYRSAQIPVSLLPSVIQKYGIKTVIRFNHDGKDSKHKSSHPMTSKEDERLAVINSGAKFYKLSSTDAQKEVNSLLNGGNVLIHCAHGADRTGGNVGGYLYSIGWGDTRKIWDYTTQYNGWERMIRNTPNTFVKGYLQQAQKFGVKDFDHARKLSS